MKSQNGIMCQLISLMLCSLSWISRLLKMGLIGCPETIVRNYHSVLSSTSEEHMPHVIWWCRPLFGSAWYSSEWSGLVRSGSGLHTCIEDILTYLTDKFQEQSSSCMQVNVVMSPVEWRDMNLFFASCSNFLFIDITTEIKQFLIR